MTPKTAKQVQSDIYALLKDSALAKAISGKVYRSGLRPRDSRLEDAVVTFTAGLPDEIQTGVVTVTIYVPDIDPFNNGVMVENGYRAAQIELLAAEWVEQLEEDAPLGYLFSLASTIQTFEDEDIHQHFVSVRLKYKFYQ